jgi:dTDP-4-amino-4,6-dideoxygalactose transaminase
MSSSSFTPTPVLRPRLPEADRLLPYLRRIDQNRVYANFGPLALELAERLAARLSLRGENIVTAASGTAALIGAILGTVGRAGGEKPLALVPGFSFIATAVAAESCGYEVVFADVDEGSGLLEPAEVLNNPLLDRIGLVIPVGAFGKGIQQSGWMDFRKTTGVGVVIDGAACFEAIDRAPGELLGEIPVALSFHATKSFASGEGGCAITSDPEAARDIVRALNFGFYGSRECRAASINGKMSEYHAAVGLAELDGWSEKSRALTAVADQYRTSFEEAGLDGRFLGAPEIASCYALFHCKSAREGQGLSEYLEARGIGGRFWYGGGGHKEPYFAPRPALRVVEETAAALLGLPVAPDLAREKIKEIVSCIGAFERLA